MHNLYLVAEIVHVCISGLVVLGLHGVDLSGLAENLLPQPLSYMTDTVCIEHSFITSARRYCDLSC